ncbi:MAG: hypothetical protein RIQ55_1193 [Pseudomonadota bacterium]|jgi:hypothetical protein
MMRIPEIVALERLTEPLASSRVFAGRVFRSMFFGTLIVLTTLFTGMAGYHYLEDIPWLDAFVNTTMIMSGMGVLDAPTTVYGKLFEGFYALFCGLILIVATAIAFTPVIHRFLHKLHIEDDE